MRVAPPTHNVSASDFQPTGLPAGLVRVCGILGANGGGFDSAGFALSQYSCRPPSLDRDRGRSRSRNVSEDTAGRESMELVVVRNCSRRSPDRLGLKAS